MLLQTKNHLQTLQYGIQMTPFGAPCQDVTETEVTEKIDLLVPLAEIWGDIAIANRNVLYAFISGDCDDAVLHQFSKYLYLRSPAFCNYVTEKFYFGDQDTPLLQRIIKPARDIVMDYMNTMTTRELNKGSKILGVNNYYLYVERK